MKPRVRTRIRVHARSRISRVKEKEICIRRADAIDTAFDFIYESADKYLRKDVAGAITALNFAEKWAKTGRDLGSKLAEDLLRNIDTLRGDIAEKKDPIDYDQTVTYMGMAYWEQMLDEYCECLKELKKYV